ncbi:MAG: hypothetical protein ACI4MG_06365 [Aristaeellaceae bacterium]
MDRQEGEYTMLSAQLMGMHRHTRPAAYADKKMKRRAVNASRPGAYGFSFTGEFPEMSDWQPVEATDRRRRYAMPNGQTGSYQALGRESAAPMRAVNRYGICLRPAIVMLTVLALLLSGLVVYQYAENARIAKLLSEQTQRMDKLAVEANTTLSDIAAQSNGVNIRQEATRIGLKSSRGVAVEYLSVPEDAMFGPGISSGTQDLANIWVQ